MARFWGYLVGAILLGSGLEMLTRKWARRAAITVGALMLVITLVLYLPIFLMATATPGQVEGVNYVADTLLFGASLMLLAAALKPERRVGFADRN